jgi:hypothetical protein
MLSRRKFLQISAASTGLAIAGTDLLSQAVANASSTVRAQGSRGIRHIVIMTMENRSFDHFLGWVPGADGRHDLTFVSAVDGNTYPNYPLAPDFQGRGYSDPDHSWEGWLVEHNHGKMDGFLQRPTTPANNPGVTLAAANTFPIGYYTNLDSRGDHKALPDLPVTGRALAALPIGRLADRYGPRGVLIGVEVVQGAATAGYLVVHGWWGFLAVSVVVAVTQLAAPPLIQALVGELAAADRRTRILAVHRTVINIGISAGSLQTAAQYRCPMIACPSSSAARCGWSCSTPRASCSSSTPVISAIPVSGPGGSCPAAA